MTNGSASDWWSTVKVADELKEKEDRGEWDLGGWGLGVIGDKYGKRLKNESFRYLRLKFTRL